MKKVNFAQIMTVGKTVGKFLKDHKQGIKKIVKYGCGTAAIGYAVAKAPKTIHDLEDAGNKKGEALTLGEKTKIVVKNQYPAMIMGGVAVGADISLAVDASKETKALKEEKESLLGQIADIGNAYNTVNAVKEAMAKKVEEDHGTEVVNDIRQQAVAPITQNRYTNVPVKDRAYVFSREKLEEWNDIYLRTGDIDFKVQEYFIPEVGQSILSCNNEIDRTEQKLINMMDPEHGKGFITLNDVLSALHARPVNSSLGDNLVWRWQFEAFGIIPSEMNLEGGVVFRLDFFKDPYYDIEREYYE